MLIFSMSPSYRLVTSLKQLLDFPVLQFQSAQDHHSVCVTIMLTIRWLFFPTTLFFKSVFSLKREIISVALFNTYLVIGTTCTRAHGIVSKQASLLEIQQTKQKKQLGCSSGGTLCPWQQFLIFHLSPPPLQKHPPTPTYSNNHVLLIPT